MTLKKNKTCWDGLNCHSCSDFKKILEKYKVMFSKVHATLPTNLQKMRFANREFCRIFSKFFKAVIFKVINAYSVLHREKLVLLVTMI